MDEFLTAIVADLDDDGPQLVYVDHLESQCNPRGEFIVLQCELAKLNLGAVALAQSENFAGLQSLDLNNNSIGERGKKALAESKVLEKTRVSVGR